MTDRAEKNGLLVALELAIAASVDMVLDQSALGPRDRFSDHVTLQDNAKARTLVFDHCDNTQQRIIGTFQPLCDFRAVA